jgi:hypothetical protein
MAADPIRCWARAEKSAVHVGERFTLVLTCGVVETSSTKVVPDEAQLDPAAIQLTPYEVVGGAHHADIMAPPWRYLQYEYTVRLLGDEFFGRDVDVPPIRVTYTVESAGTGERGREHEYLLPALPMRIASLAPANTGDIRDASGDTFAQIEARRVRADSELAAAAVFLAFTLVLLGLAGVRLKSSGRERAPAEVLALPRGAVLRSCLRETARLRSEVTKEGWSQERVTRALSACRLAGAVAMGRPVAHTFVEGGVQGREGQLSLARGLRRKRALISASITTEAIAGRSGSRAPEGARPRGPGTQETREAIGGALGVFAAARYGRNGTGDPAMLDRALEDATAAVRRLRLELLLSGVPPAWWSGRLPRPRA